MTDNPWNGGGVVSSRLVGQSEKSGDEPSDETSSPVRCLWGRDIRRDVPTRVSAATRGTYGIANPPINRPTVIDLLWFSHHISSWTSIYRICWSIGTTSPARWSSGDSK